MRCDVVLAGVGGQGVLSAAAILAEAARRDGLQLKQGEVHGMAQRGGAVRASLRMADTPIHSDLVAAASADVLLALEPLEALRALETLRPGGSLFTASTPNENIADYPPIDSVLDTVRRVPGAVILDALALAREAGNRLAANTVMVGAASTVLPLGADTLERCIADRFAAKGPKAVDANLAAFRAGRAAAVPA
jgi:indolepyruvate ferredoxin oxidoreductase beta subunit